MTALEKLEGQVKELEELGLDECEISYLVTHHSNMAGYFTGFESLKKSIKNDEVEFEL